MNPMAGFGAALRIAVRRIRWFWVVWILALVGLLTAAAGTYAQLLQGPSLRSCSRGSALTRRCEPSSGSRSISEAKAASRYGEWAGSRPGPRPRWQAGASSGSRAGRRILRAELVRAGAVGPHAPLVAALFTAILASVVLGCGVALSLVVSDTSAAGAVAAGAAIAASAWMWAGVGAWLIGMLVAALTCGMIGVQMDDVIAQNPKFADLVRQMAGGGSSTTISFLSTMLAILSVVMAVAAVRFLGMVRSKETAGRSELVLASATSRGTFWLSHLLYGLVGGSALLGLVGFVLPIPQLGKGDSLALVGDFTQAGLALLPGLWLIVGVDCLLVGWAPPLCALTWVLVGWSLFCSWFAALFHVPEWRATMEPVGYLPRLPIDDMDWTPFILESVLALALMVAGSLEYHRRNMPTA